MLRRFINAVGREVGLVPAAELQIEKQINAGLVELAKANAKRVTLLEGLEGEAITLRRINQSLQNMAVGRFPLRVPNFAPMVDARGQRDFATLANRFEIVTRRMTVQFLIPEFDLERMHPDERHLAYQVYAEKLGKEFGKSVEQDALAALKNLDPANARPARVPDPSNPGRPRC